MSLRSNKRKSSKTPARLSAAAGGKHGAAASSTLSSPDTVTVFDFTGDDSDEAVVVQMTYTPRKKLRVGDNKKRTSKRTSLLPSGAAAAITTTTSTASKPEQQQQQQQQQQQHRGKHGNALQLKSPSVPIASTSARRSTRSRMKREQEASLSASTSNKPLVEMTKAAEQADETEAASTNYPAVVDDWCWKPAAYNHPPSSRNTSPARVTQQSQSAVVVKKENDNNNNNNNNKTNQQQQEEEEEESDDGGGKVGACRDLGKMVASNKRSWLSRKKAPPPSKPTDVETVEEVVDASPENPSSRSAAQSPTTSAIVAGNNNVTKHYDASNSSREKSGDSSLFRTDNIDHGYAPNKTDTDLDSRRIAECSLSAAAATARSNRAVASSRSNKDQEHGSNEDKNSIDNDSIPTSGKRTARVIFKDTPTPKFPCRKKPRKKNSSHIAAAAAAIIDVDSAVNRGKPLGTIPGILGTSLAREDEEKLSASKRLEERLLKRATKRRTPPKVRDDGDDDEPQWKGRVALDDTPVMDEKDDTAVAVVEIKQEEAAASAGATMSSPATGTSAGNSASDMATAAAAAAAVMQQPCSATGIPRDNSPASMASASVAAAAAAVMAITDTVSNRFNPTTTNAETNPNADDAIEWIGTTNETRLPHMRQHCLECRFDPHNEKSVNKHFCSLCWCYVCDIPAKDCKSWANKNFRMDNHCHASDRNEYSDYWKEQREAAKRAKETPAEEYQVGANLKYGEGPFSPDDVVAARDPNLTPCRKCGYFNRLFHRNFRHFKKLHPIGFLDWCMKCGRVASEKDFAKAQSKPYTEQKGDVCLGKKDIPFRLVAHDPRKMSRYAASWNKHADDWTYEEAEMQEDLFCHRFGERPTPQMILASIPIVEEKDMPKDGDSFIASFTETLFVSSTPLNAGFNDRYYNSYCGRDRFHYWKNGSKAVDGVSVDETEGVILNNAIDILLFQQICSFEQEGFCRRRAATATTEAKKSLLSYDITAKWDKKSKKGTFVVRLYVQLNKKFKPKEGSSLNKLLGSWYDVFPFALSEVSGTLTASAPLDFDAYPECNDYHVPGFTRVPVPPFRIQLDKREDLADKIEIDRNVAIEKHNAWATGVRNNLCFQSTEEGRGLGGQCLIRKGFSNVLQGYFKELVVEDIYRGSTNQFNGGARWLDVCLGVVSKHRKMRLGGKALPGPDKLQTESVTGTRHDLCYLNMRDQALARSLNGACQSIFLGTKSMKGIINHCENLGHAEIPPFDGLNVELLQFQRQSVQWALERETMDGGIQCLFWPRLPIAGTRQKQERVYFNPITETFRTKKPHVIRGGIIAEEMGLGKTIISLALILVNPAPDLPCSDTPVTALDSLQSTRWDKSLYARTQSAEGANPKKGGILSRGTLVVCHVSLVGQWIEEAKSKLKDPGLVYPYHGGSRKRNARLLARNAIVVTTYDTLASDATYHAEKGGANYVAPLAQVRWWRIICDESHALKDGNTGKSKAVMDLSADHKWLVSGTPVNTSLVDLKNQLKFLGLESFNEMFVKFANTLRHTHDRSAKQGSRKRPGSSSLFDPEVFALLQEEMAESRHFGHFMYLLRCIMMRHSQQQTYRGTGPPATTLMSLPPKTERTVEIEFTEQENQEYAKLEDAALEFYSNFKQRRSKTLSKYFLKLTQKLLPMRVACAGGRIPLGDGAEELDDNDNDNDNNNDGDPTDLGNANEGQRKEIKYSKFMFQSKFKRLLQELKHARDNDPSSKSLVFSQFTSSLQYLQEELPKHGFQFRTLSGDMPMRKRARALFDFQHDPPTTIFLLSMRAGAVGINLTQANRVFLLEPCFNPAVERQSIGRVHRLGQKRNVEIIRLVIKDSIEARMLEMLERKYGGSHSEDSDPSNTSLVGCVKSDKSSILGAEFDILFGVPPSVASVPDSGDTPPVLDELTLPEPVMSFGAGAQGDLSGQTGFL